MKKRRGFSIVELVISLLLIAIMAAGVFSTISVSISLKRKNTIRSSALREVENVAKCFVRSDSSAALNFYAGEGYYNYSDGSCTVYTVYYDADGNIVKKEDGTSYDFYIEVTTSGESVTEISAKYSDGDSIYTWSKS